MDKDGRADHSKVFLDSLVLPRAIAHVYGGLLYAVPPNLWFAEINDDKPGKKILVDSLYSDGGNPENQPNGLITDVDNWIYSANSNFRFQRKDGKWIKEPNSFEANGVFPKIVTDGFIIIIMRRNWWVIMCYLIR